MQPASARPVAAFRLEEGEDEFEEVAFILEAEAEERQQRQSSWWSRWGCACGRQALLASGLAGRLAGWPGWPC
jgi:hypothetical protein